jgi:hypothetical protein
MWNLGDVWLQMVTEDAKVAHVPRFALSPAAYRGSWTMESNGATMRRLFPGSLGSEGAH